MTDSDSVYPKFFTFEEGGDWLPCPKGYCLSKHALMHHEKYAHKVWYKDRNYRVHSLAFDGIQKDRYDFPRWDEFNGWTTPI